MTQVEQLRRRFGKERKKDWFKMSSRMFETILFVELNFGERFIILPRPDSIEGLTAEHYEFLKITEKELVDPTTGKKVNSVCICDGSSYLFSPETAVIKLK